MCTRKINIFLNYVDIYQMATGMGTFRKHFLIDSTRLCVIVLKRCPVTTIRIGILIPTYSFCVGYLTHCFCLSRELLAMFFCTWRSVRQRLIYSCFQLCNNQVWSVQALIIIILHWWVKNMDKMIVLSYECQCLHRFHNF